MNGRVRFAALHGYDNVREPRLPPELRDKNPNGTMWRKIDGEWTRGDVPVIGVGLPVVSRSY